MKPLYLKTVLFMVVLILGFSIDSQADGMAKIAKLENWLKDNRVFVETQFQLLELPVEATFDAEVAHYIERYLRPGRHETERMLAKAAHYFPIFEAELSARKLPEALKFLPVVESALHPSIESPVGAGGLWQFMPATADFFDLEINDWVDARYDPHRSSAAATELLSFLYEQFDDWNLALAAYNCGPGRVKRAIRRAGVASYEAIKKQLPKQTQRYITKFKAAAYAMSYHDFFGLEARPAERLPSEVESIVLEERVTFAEIAEKADVPVGVVRTLNPAFLQEVVPASPEKPYRVLLPTAAVRKWIEYHREPETAGSPGYQSVDVTATVIEDKEEILRQPMAFLPELPNLQINGLLWRPARPLPHHPPAGKEPSDSKVVWHQRQGIVELWTVE